MQRNPSTEQDSLCHVITDFDLARHLLTIYLALNTYITFFQPLLGNAQRAF
jgi:hypothetical protein